MRRLTHHHTTNSKLGEKDVHKVNNAGAAYLRLEELKVQRMALEISRDTLQAISKDRNSKLYFLNGDSPQPLPLMNIGKSGE